MPDYPTNAPAAGWYTDPADPAQERWWGGVEWTHDVRPLAAVAPVPAPQPELVNVPGGGVNPFAAFDAQEAGTAAGSFGGAAEQQASAFSSFPNYDTGTVSIAPNPYATPAAQPSFTVNPSWYESSGRSEQQGDPGNGFATAGLVLSLVGLSVAGIVFSILGLRKARRFEDDGELPVGRKRSRWGLGLGIASFIITMALTVAYFFAFQFFYALLLEQMGASAVQTQQTADDLGVETDQLVIEPNGAPAVYDRSKYEQAFIESYTEGAGAPPDWITCPDSVDMVVGAVITCQFAFQGVPHEFSITITDIHGGGTTILDGVPVQ